MKTFIPVNAGSTKEEILDIVAFELFNIIADNLLEHNENLDMTPFFDEDGVLSQDVVNFIDENMTDTMCQFYVDSEYSILQEVPSEDSFIEMHHNIYESEEFQPLCEAISKYINDNQ